MNANPTIDAPQGNFSYPCGEYRLFRITHTDPDSLRFLPKLHIRALEFLEKYGAETDPVFLTRLLYETLKNPQTQNLVHALVAVDRSDSIVAHSLTYADTLGQLGPVAMQMQTEKDHSVDPVSGLAIHDTGLRLIEEWTRSLNLRTIIAYALSPAIARLDKRDGFRTYRVMLRKDL